MEQWYVGGVNSAAYWIRRLSLRRHPEGGCYRETYRSSESIPAEALPRRFKGGRCFATAIYFLLRAGEHSAFHRIKSDELWLFHDGGPLVLHVIGLSGTYRRVRLGQGRQATLQAVVPAGAWFAAELSRRASFALVTCVVAPGFDFADFELADRAHLSARFPRLRRIIGRLASGGRS